MCELRLLPWVIAAVGTTCLPDAWLGAADLLYGGGWPSDGTSGGGPSMAQPA